MYSFYPKKEYNLAWSEIIRFNPDNRWVATRQPGWFGNEVVTFRPDTDPFFFFHLFIDIGKILGSENPLFGISAPPRIPKKSFAEVWVDFSYPYPNPAEMKKLCVKFGGDYIKTSKKEYYIKASSLKTLADIGVAYGCSIPGSHPFHSEILNPQAEPIPDFFQRFQKPPSS